MLCEPLDGVEIHAHTEQIWRLKFRPSCIAVKLFGSADHIDGTRECVVVHTVTVTERTSELEGIKPLRLALCQQVDVC